MAPTLRSVISSRRRTGPPAIGCNSTGAAGVRLRVGGGWVAVGESVNDAVGVGNKTFHVDIGDERGIGLAVDDGATLGGTVIVRLGLGDSSVAAIADGLEGTVVAREAQLINNAMEIINSRMEPNEINLIGNEGTCQVC